MLEDLMALAGVDADQLSELQETVVEETVVEEAPAESDETADVVTGEESDEVLTENADDKADADAGTEESPEKEEE